MLTLFWDCASRQPDRAVNELDTHSPTVVVKTGSIEDERTMSGLLPVARIARPSLVRRNSVRNAITAAGTEAQSKQQQLDAGKGTLPFDSRRAAEERIEELAKTIERRKAALRNAEKAYTDSAGRVRELKAAIAGLEEQLSGGPEPDREGVTRQKAELTRQRKALEDRIKGIHAGLAANRSALAGIRDKAGELEALETRRVMVCDLSATANGTLSGKEKIMLETYVQTTYFDRIIDRANTRLMMMTGGQYELKRRIEAENQKSQSGLDLDVVDHYNGSERSVKSLSGGESFKASLSLALGLSDEIQSSSGGVRLDTMFVDEGFGSLDEESLDQAMKALTGLTEGNRLVGIISHVAELKNRIDRQIVVTKERSGGSKAQIVL